MQLPPELLKPSWILAGPTASGKTAAALELAEMVGGEIVALDSMTVYRGMDVGTAKPTAAERERVPHHLLDVVSPSEEYTLADYLCDARSACREILARGKTPLFVGGTGLYLRGLLRGVFAGPEADWDLRRRWDAYAEAEGEFALHERLQQVDAPTASRLHPHDRRRIIRALEVFELTGQPLSRQQNEQPLPPDERPCRVAWLSPPRDWLYSRIDRRVEEMFAAGLVDEVQWLRDSPGGLGRTATQALGYKEVLDYLAGRGTLPETIRQIQTRTRQFAKRQHTWFRNLVECHPLEITGNESPNEIAVELCASN